MQREDIERILGEEAARLTAWLRGQGEAAVASAEAVSEYASRIADELALAAGEPGFDRAAEAAAHNVALFAGIQAADTGDRIDSASRLAFVEGMRGLLGFAAKALALLA